jgi:phenylacetate 2-hydroxylase
MTLVIYAAAAVVICFFAYRFLYGTDTPHIKGIPEIPGLPLFGSLFELGIDHAKVAQRWAKKYGPVFQVRMGNRVCTLGSSYLVKGDSIEGNC